MILFELLTAQVKQMYVHCTLHRYFVIINAGIFVCLQQKPVFVIMRGWVDTML